MKPNPKKLAISAILSAAVLSLSAINASAHMEPRKGDNLEKCYGVMKAGMNDCASKGNKHACAGMSKTKIDGDPNEWVKLPKGLCEKLANGSLMPGDEAAEAEEEHYHRHEGHGH